MKRYGILALAVLLCCTIFAGCRRVNNGMMPQTPTNEATAEAPTMPTVMPSTRPATEPVTVPPTEPVTVPPTEHETADATEGSTGSTESATTDATEGARGRSGPNRPAMR